MATDIKVPSVGESIAEGTLVRWLKQDGAAVRADDMLFELETEKATTEVPAPAAGMLHISVPDGATVKIGAVVGRIDEVEAVRAKVDAPARRAPEPPGKLAEPGKPSGKLPEPGKPPPRRTDEPQQPASPAARRLAQESGVDLAALHGTGRDGRIVKEDVQAKVEPPPSPTKPAEPAPTGRETRQRMSAIRQRIAERLVTSQKGTATLTTFNEADLSAVTALRSQYKERFKEKHGVGLGLTGFFVKAVVAGLREFPLIHSRIDGADIVTPNTYDIGVAVSTERGLIVPVLHDADRLSFSQIEKTIAELAQKARVGKIAVSDLQGGNFTITNGGVFGSLLSTPILNPPQSAILGLHAIQKRPVAVNDQVVIRPMMYLALSYDHRLIDGRDAVLFLVRIKECIEQPERLWLEV